MIAHIRHSAQDCGYTQEDVSLNWLPFDHVVPLLTYHMADVYLGRALTLTLTLALTTMRRAGARGAAARGAGAAATAAAAWAAAWAARVVAWAAAGCRAGTDPSSPLAG